MRAANVEKAAGSLQERAHFFLRRFLRPSHLSLMLLQATPELHFRPRKRVPRAYM